MKNHRTPQRVFFFANFPTEDSRSIGGATVLAERVYRFVRRDPRLEVVHRQIRKHWKPKTQLWDYFKWFFKFPFAIRRFDVVSFHVTRDFHPTIAPFLWLWAKLSGKKIVYHLFGGGFHREYEHYPYPLRKLIERTILRSDYFLVETKELVEYFRPLVKHRVVWFPNSREPFDKVDLEKPFEKKFVFISRITQGKGVEEIIEAAGLLPEGYVIDAYGPVDKKSYEKNPFENTAVRYKGVLAPRDVIPTISEYDAMLMPTAIPREGYPGTIIEALAAARPVITTECCVMHEIIENGYNGFRVPPQNAGKLAEAIQSVTPDNYSALRKNALESFQRNFNSQKVFKKITNAYLE